MNNIVYRNMIKVLDDADYKVVREGTMLAIMYRDLTSFLISVVEFDHSEKRTTSKKRLKLR